MSDLFRSVDRLRSSLDYHMSRHNVLSSNVANAETPGFRPLELLRDTPAESAPTLPMAATSEGHVGVANEEAARYETREDRDTLPGANGNAVALEHEMSKLAANDIRFEGAVKIVSHQLGMLRYAANDGSGG
ncbi:MAG: Flagellar basal-body rod protein FlgB [Myxococcaceae bacterium]|nr:Flagellar basal-body rod protein FlgB [Myxococcaceae bacterium]